LLVGCHSEETKAKISEASREVWKDSSRREAAREAWLKKDQTSRDKCLSGLIPGIGQAAAAAANSKAVLVTNLETGETVEKVSIRKVAIELGIDESFSLHTLRLLLKSQCTAIFLII
jgi:hypothetical protein